MKLIEKEQAGLIIANENFVCIDTDNSIYELDGVKYVLVEDNVFELEDVTDEPVEDMEPTSVEALVDAIASEIGL